MMCIVVTLKVNVLTKFFVLRNDVLENLLEFQSPVYWFFIQVSFSLQCKLVHIHTKYLEIFLALV